MLKNDCSTIHVVYFIEENMKMEMKMDILQHLKFIINFTGMEIV